MSQSPIFVKTYDLLLWLLPATTKFPREHRFMLAQQVQGVSLRFQECLIEAATVPQQNRQDKVACLNRADIELTKLRFYLRLCRDLRLLKPKQHRHASQMVDEIGRLLGGWLKTMGGASNR